MKPEAIVFTSQTGFTRQYAHMLGQMLSLPVYSLEEAVSKLPGGHHILYLGWVHASHVRRKSVFLSVLSAALACAIPEH